MDLHDELLLGMLLCRRFAGPRFVGCNRDATGLTGQISESSTSCGGSGTVFCKNGQRLEEMTRPRARALALSTRPLQRGRLSRARMTRCDSTVCRIALPGPSLLARWP